MRDKHPTIKTKCQVLSGKRADCSGCQWFPSDQRVRMYDCRGFTAWLVRQVGLDLAGQGATSQYKTASNWVQKGSIESMPDCVCCLFRKNGSSMEHTGMHLGGGVVIDCSVNVRSVGLSGWTHYGIPAGLYAEGEIPTTIIKPTLRKGTEGDLVKELQAKLNALGYDCGTVDGNYGKKTAAAVKAFQTAQGLTADGICGVKTWAALDDSPQKQQLYKVTCHGMTFKQYQQIREICPTATVDKE